MINSVRNAVLTILNKNNYGYISPGDFNLLAQNAQMEIYESYFRDYNKTINEENLRTSGTDYANKLKPLSEVLEYFLVSKFLVPAYLNTYYYPSEVTTGYNAYMVSKMMYYKNMLASSVTTSVTANLLVDTSGDFINKGVKIGDIVLNKSTYQSTVVVEVVSLTTLRLLDDLFALPSQEYSIFDYTQYSEFEKVSNGEMSGLLKSNLTSPSDMYPSYTNLGDVISVFPDTINEFGAVRSDYFRFPKPPKWTYVSLSGGEPAFDQSQPDYQDFEVPLEDEYKLVTKILEYCGIVIRDTTVAQFAANQNNKNTAAN